MQNRTPAAPNRGAPLPDFLPVPRQCARHDGWTPERQRAFIEALADTGSVSRAAAQVNMAAEGAYALRRHPQAGGFRAAWEAALDYGVARMKDLAFERAIDGYLVPVFAGGRLLGYRRKHNDRLLMFCLRHYGEDAHGKRTTINYFSTKATAGAVSSSPALAGEGDHVKHGGGATSAAQAEASTTTVRTVITRPAPSAGEKDPHAIDQFAGVELDPAARDAIAAILADCAARRRALENTAGDPQELFFPAAPPPPPNDGILRVPRLPAPNEVDPDAFLEADPRMLIQPDDQYRSGPEEMPWQMLDQEEEMARIEAAVASVKAAQRESTADKTNDGAADASAYPRDAEPDPAAATPRNDEAGFTPGEPPVPPSAQPGEGDHPREDGDGGGVKSESTAAKTNDGAADASTYPRDAQRPAALDGRATAQRDSVPRSTSPPSSSRTRSGTQPPSKKRIPKK